MAKFSVGGEEDGEGPSSPRRKRQRNAARSAASDEDGEQREEGEQQQQQEVVHYRGQPEGEEDQDRKEENEIETHEIEDQRRDLRSGSNSRNVEGHDGSISVIFTDPELLDCPICCEALTIPVFQCENGHIACSSCCVRIKNKCPSCSWPIGYNRCRAIEKVVDSVKVLCHHSKYGCKETVNYGKKNEHENKCTYAPCVCPLSECNFVSSAKHLSSHVRSKHPNSAIPFLYDSGFNVSLNPNEKFLVLQEENEGVVFVVNNCAEILGNVVSVSCMGPTWSNNGFLYDMKVKNEESCSLCIQSLTKNFQYRLDHPPLKGFLLIPYDFFGSRDIKLSLCIWQKGSFSSMRGQRSSGVLN